MLGLFDQPVPREVFDALIAPPAIPGLTDGMLAAEVRATQWNEAIARLRDQGLISPADGDAPCALDCHPLVREYFGQRLAQIDRTAFKAAHARLYDHYRYTGLPQAFRDPVAYGVLALKAAHEGDHYPTIKDGLLDGSLSQRLRAQLPRSIAQLRPQDLQAAFALVDGPQCGPANAAFMPDDEAGMNPLFSAIAHGCAAEREAETWNQVYWPRIKRGNQNFAMRNLGLYGQELVALASFFETPFAKLSPRVPANDRRLALSNAGYGLRALGRLEDAAEPMRAGIKESEDIGDWEGAAVDAGNLSELLVSIGRLSGEDGAVAAGEAAETFADHSGDAELHLGTHADHTDAVFQVGSLAHAEALAREAEALSREAAAHELEALPPEATANFQWALFGSDWRYCDLLVACGRGPEAADRVAYAIKFTQEGNWPLLIGWLTLSQARAALANAPLDLPAPKDCASRSAAALAALRRANEEIL